MDYKKRYGIWGKGDKTEGRGKVNPQDGGKWCSQDDCCVVDEHSPHSNRSEVSRRNVFNWLNFNWLNIQCLVYSERFVYPRKRELIN